MQTHGTCLHHTVLLVGVTDPGNSGVFIFESWIYMGISTFSNAHNFVKNLVWTSFYSPFWSSWADLSFAPTFRVWRQILFSASAFDQGHSTAVYTGLACGKNNWDTRVLYEGLLYGFVRIRCARSRTLLLSSMAGPHAAGAIKNKRHAACGTSSSLLKKAAWTLNYWQ